MAQDHWIDVKSKVEGLGLKLKLHLQQEDDDADERESGSTRAAFDDLGDRLEDAFEAFGNAAKDPAVRSDVKEIGLLLKHAISETMTEAGAEVNDRFRSSKVTETGTPGATATEAPGPFKDSDDDTLQDRVEGAIEDAVEDGDL